MENIQGVCLICIWRMKSIDELLFVAFQRILLNSLIEHDEPKTQNVLRDFSVWKISLRISDVNFKMFFLEKKEKWNTLRRNVTNPKWRSAGTSNRSSLLTKDSKSAAILTPWIVENKCSINRATVFCFYISNMFLESFDAERTNDEPEFQRSESTTQRNLPMLKRFSSNEIKENDRKSPLKTM